MKLNSCNIWLFLAAAMLGMGRSSLSQVITRQSSGNSRVPIKGVLLSITVETNVITSVSTNMLKCRLVNESTNIIRGLKYPLEIGFKNMEDGEFFHLPAFESVEMVPNSDQPMSLGKFEQLKPGQDCEWAAYFSTGHPFELVQIPERFATNQNAKLYCETLNSMRCVKTPGDYQIQINNCWVAVPNGQGGEDLHALDSNLVEIKSKDQSE